MTQSFPVGDRMRVLAALGYSFAPTTAAEQPTTNRNRPFNIAQNAAKRAVSEVLRIPQRHVHAGMEAYRIAYRAARYGREGAAS